MCIPPEDIIYISSRKLGKKINNLKKDMTAIGNNLSPFCI